MYPISVDMYSDNQEIYSQVELAVSVSIALR